MYKRSAWVVHGWCVHTVEAVPLLIPLIPPMMGTMWFGTCSILQPVVHSHTQHFDGHFPVNLDKLVASLSFLLHSFFCALVHNHRQIIVHEWSIWLLTVNLEKLLPSSLLFAVTLQATATCLLQNFEFHVYESYADDVTKENGRMRLHALLQNSAAVLTLEVVLWSLLSTVFCITNNLLL